jgi:undecaprenyl-diphosphatase
MLNLFQAIILGSLQGVSELFPISSLGHSVILPSLFGWNIDQKDPYFLTFLVAVHTGTALVLFLYFFKSWQKIISGFFRSLARREIRDGDKDAKLAWLLIVATVPAGIIGILLEHVLKNLFGKPQIVAIILIINGLMLLAGDYLRKKTRESTNRLTWGKGIFVGFMQCLALIPGFSRTGSTITGGLLVGLNYEEAAQFSFLLATPIIAGATLVKLPTIIKGGNLEISLVGGFFAGLFAYLSIKFLTKYFQSQKLWPFAVYCIAAGLITIFLLH